MTHEIHCKAVKGEYYNDKGTTDYSALCNYRHLIPNIVVVLRCQEASQREEGWLRLDGEGVDILPIHEPQSLFDAFFHLPSMIRQIIEGIKACDYYQVRMPGPTGMLVATILLIMRKPYGVECVGHVSEGFLYIYGRSCLNRLIAWFFRHITRFLIYKAHCVAYRSRYLKMLYPNKNRQKEYVFSGAQIDEQARGSIRPRHFFESEPFTIMYVGRLEAEKGLSSLLKGFKEATKKTSKIMSLHFIGGGRELDNLCQLAKELQLSNKIVFHGLVARGPSLFSLLDKAHLFVIPSLTEGMPRALIEAMARGLPALGSRTGGIIELLPDDFLFEPGNAEAIAEKLCEIINDPEKLHKMSQDNFELSREHWVEALRVEKEKFWNELCSSGIKYA